jgi:hypothetical protein
MCQSVWERVGSGEAQADPQRRKEVRVHHVREGVQAAGPSVSGPQVLGRGRRRDSSSFGRTRCGGGRRRSLTGLSGRNGHMLTHRNKKPYECKAEGCGKSYCDARSLRRHTENHHSSSTVNAATTTMSPAQGAASGDAASPHGSSCIQYAPPPTSTTGGKSQLQQLLATEPAKVISPPKENIRHPSGSNLQEVTPPRAQTFVFPLRIFDRVCLFIA